MAGSPAGQPAARQHAARGLPVRRARCAGSPRAARCQRWGSGARAPPVTFNLLRPDGSFVGYGCAARADVAAPCCKAWQLAASAVSRVCPVMAVLMDMDTLSLKSWPCHPHTLSPTDCHRGIC